MFQGVFTAMVTPFKNGKIDTEAFDKLVKRQKEAGVHGVLIGGCTGESFTVSLEERIELIKTALKYKDNNFKILAGTGSNNTEIALKFSKTIDKMDVDGLLVITPFANKPSQNGLIEYYKEIASNVEKPIIMYNVPGRTGVNLLPETIAELSKVENIVAIKQANANFDLMTKIRLLTPEIDLLSGEDTLTLPLLSIGGKGVICTVSNVAPHYMSTLVNSYFEGDIEKAREYHFKLFNLIKTMFIETNPAPTKYALKVMGLLNGELRKPLVEITEPSKKVVEKELKNAGLI